MNPVPDAIPLPPVVRIVAIHEDFASAVRIGQTFASLALKLGPAVTFNNWILSFEHLARRDIRPQASREAAAADLIIVAAHGDKPLPEHVTKWLEHSCILKLQNPGGLVALHDNGSDGDTPLTAQLQDICQRWKLQYLGSGNWNKRLNRGTIEGIIAAREGMSLSA